MERTMDEMVKRATRVHALAKEFADAVGSECGGEVDYAIVVRDRGGMIHVVGNGTVQEDVADLLKRGATNLLTMEPLVTIQRDRQGGGVL